MKSWPIGKDPLGNWCWEILKAGEEGIYRGWDTWIASPNQWTRIWANSMTVKDTETWHAIVHGVTKSQTQLSDWTTKETEKHFLALSDKTWSPGEGDGRRWDGWMASPIRWTWVWANSGRCWRTGKPGILQSMGLQRVGFNWATEWQLFSICRSLLLGSVSLPFSSPMCAFYP